MSASREPLAIPGSSGPAYTRSRSRRRIRA
jgi:hypothetical protein